MFNKKIAVAAVLGLGALGLSGTALAYSSQGQQGVYVAVQGGWANAHYGNTIKDDFQSDAVPGTSFSSSEGGFGGNALIGYQFNSYYSVEGGYTYLPSNKYTISAGGADVALHENTHAWDILGKANLPLDQISSSLKGFNAFVKGGAAYEHASLSLSGTGFSTSTLTSHNAWVPVAGFGASYDINSNVAADVAYTHFFGHKTTASSTHLEAPSADMVTLGVSYLFS